MKKTVLALGFRANKTLKQFASIINAQKTRGLKVKHINIFRSYLPMLVPLLLKSLEGSNRMVLTMGSRGFEGK